MQIQNLVAAGNLEKAIKMLENEYPNEAILLMGRYSRNEASNRRGIIDKKDYDREHNRIADAVLSYAGCEPLSTPNNSNDSSIGLGFESTLLRISAENKRRNTVIYDECQAIIKEYREYKDTKAVNPLHDTTGRRYKIIEAKANDLIAKLNETKELSKEDFAKAIEKLLSATIPTYEELADAYKLANGRKFKSHWIEQQLESKPNDTEVRIRIAEEIEIFVSSI